MKINSFFPKTIFCSVILWEKSKYIIEKKIAKINPPIAPE